MRLTLQEAGGSVSGSCTLAVTGEPEPYWSGTVSGTHAHPDVGLTISAPEFNDLSLAGSFTNDGMIHGVLNGTTGLADTPITLARQ